MKMSLHLIYIYEWVDKIQSEKNSSNRLYYIFSLTTTHQKKKTSWWKR